MRSSHRWRFRRNVTVLSVLLVAVVGAACQPPPPSGRNTPVRRVVLVGDSVSWGLFLSTPAVRSDLEPQLRRRGIRFTLIGGPGETPLMPWPGRAPWSDDLARVVAAENPDVVIIQTMLFPNAADPGLHEQYRAAVRRLYDIAQSRGARVFRATHPVAVNPAVAQETFIAQTIQADEAANRGIGVIGINTALERCAQPFIPDGFHLSASGQKCHAGALMAAINLLRRR